MVFYMIEQIVPIIIFLINANWSSIVTFLGIIGTVILGISTFIAIIVGILNGITLYTTIKKDRPMLKVEQYEGLNWKKIGAAFKFNDNDYVFAVIIRIYNTGYRDVNVKDIELEINNTILRRIGAIYKTKGGTYPTEIFTFKSKVDGVHVNPVKSGLATIEDVFFELKSSNPIVLEKPIRGKLKVNPVIGEQTCCDIEFEELIPQFWNPSQSELDEMFSMIGFEKVEAHAENP